MKKTFSLIIVTAIAASGLVLAGCGDSYPSELSVYPFKTVVVQYELSGGTTGDQSLFIRGDQKALHKFVTTPGQEASTFELYLGAEKYIANLDKMTAVKTTDSNYEKMLTLSAEEQEDYLIKKSLGMKDSAELPAPVTTSMVAGQICDVYEVPNVGTAGIWERTSASKRDYFSGNHQ